LAHYFRMLNPADSPQVSDAAEMLKYRGHITIDLLVGRKNVFLDQWIYVHSPDVRIARIANYKNFSKEMVKDQNTTALSVEYFAFTFDDLWNKTDELLTDMAINELEKMRLIEKREVLNAWVIRETEAYPIYYLGLQGHYDVLKSRVNQFVNLYSIGRAGMHKYNNQDHSLVSGILAARNYLRLPGSPFKLWDINVDAEYQEGAQRTNELDYCK